MRNFSKIVLHTLLLLIFVVIFLFVATMPYFYGEKYYYQDYKVRESLSGKIDTLVVGSSHALRSVKPTVLNKELNVKSYNLSSPLMSMYGRYVLLKKEVERNPIKTVYIELSYNALTLDRASLGFEGDLYVLGRLDNTTERLDFLKKAFSKEEYREVFMDTIKRSSYAISKTSKTTINQYETFGYLSVPSNDYLLTIEEKKDIFNKEKLDTKIKKENLKYFNDFIELCKENDIRIVLIVTPVTEIMLLKYQNIDELFSQYKDLSQKYNCEYYDFNLDKKRNELYSEETSFYDYTHMSDSGAEIFSTRFSKIIKKVNEGKDVSDEFYESYDQVKETILNQNNV